MSNVIHADFNVKKEKKVSENREIKQDSLTNLSLPGTWYELPNPIWLQLFHMMDARTKLFSFICRMTIGFVSKKTRFFRLFMPWPGNEQMAKIIGVSRKNNLSKARMELQRGGMIIVLKNPETKQEWVGINPLLFHLSPFAARFLGINCGKYDFTKEGWKEQIEQNEKKNFTSEEYQILYSAVSDLISVSIRFDIGQYQKLYCDKKGMLHTFSKDSKEAKPVKSLNDIFKRYLLNDRLNESDQSSALQTKNKGQNKSQHIPQTLPASSSEAQLSCLSKKENCSAPEKSLGGAEAKVEELVKHMIASHNKHCSQNGRWSGNPQEYELKESDREYGLPKAAKLILDGIHGLSYPAGLSLDQIANRYVKLVVDIAVKNSWPTAPHGGNYCKRSFTDQFLKTDQMIAIARDVKKSMLALELKQRQDAEWEKERQERERKEKEEYERAKKGFEKGERLCFGKCGKYEDLCKKCKQRTAEKWFDCRFAYARGKRKA